MSRDKEGGPQGLTAQGYAGWNHADLPTQTGGAIMKLTPVGVDIAKNVFRVHHVDEETGEIIN